MAVRVLTVHSTIRPSFVGRLTLWFSLAPFAPFVGLIGGGLLGSVTVGDAYEVISLLLGGLAGSAAAHRRAARVRLALIGDDLLVVNYYRVRTVPRAQVQAVDMHFFFWGRGIACLSLKLTDASRLDLHATVFSTEKQWAVQERMLKTLL